MAFAGCGTVNRSNLNDSATASISLLALGPAYQATGLPVSAAIPTTMVDVQAPAGFLSFCVRQPGQCADPGPVKEVALTPPLWQALQDVNEQVNIAIRPQDDRDHYGRNEYWTIPTDGVGDCDDYALAKRAQLIAAGFPQAALRIAIVRTWWDEPHAVLTVVTDHGDFVLDNLVADVKAWTATDYKWVERQDPDRAMGWVSISENPPLRRSL